MANVLGEPHLSTLMRARLDPNCSGRLAVLPDGLDQFTPKTYMKSAILTIVNMTEAYFMV